MSTGYFILDSSKGAVLKSSTSTANLFSKEQVASFPSTKDKFFEIVPAIVVDSYTGDSRGKIKIKKLIGDNAIYDAYPLICNIRILPMIGEVVLVSEYLPSEAGDNAKLAKFEIDSQRTYTNLFYLNILNTGNSVSLNKNYEFLNNTDKSNLENKKDTVSNVGKQNIVNKKDSISEYFINKRTKSLLPLEGDILFEGRSGQSIRFSQSIKKDINFTENTSLLGSTANSTENKRKNEVWVYGDVGGKPIIVISNGREETDKLDAKESLEDINKDDSSIYLSSDNILPLTQACQESAQINLDKVNGNETEVSKLPPKQFSGKQIVFNSNSVVINSRTNDISLFSGKYISLASNNQLYIKAPLKISMDSSQIELGFKAKEIGSPVAKANEVIDILNQLIERIKNTIAFSNPASIVEFDFIQKQLYKIKSDVTFSN